MTDLQTLDRYLSSDRSPDGCLQLSDLDGFLTGVLCSPELIPPSEWLPVAMGDAALSVPPEIITQVLDRYNEIAAGLKGEPPILEPIFRQAKEGHVIAMDWCEGFMEAVALRKKSWSEFLRSPEAESWMRPILLYIIDDYGHPLIETSENDFDAALDVAAEEIPETVPHPSNPRLRSADQTLSWPSSRNSERPH